MAASMDLGIEQLDMKTTFLHGNLEKEIYKEKPEGFKARGKENMVCKLRKSLYRLKQGGRACIGSSKVQDSGTRNLMLS